MVSTAQVRSASPAAAQVGHVKLGRGGFTVAPGRLQHGQGQYGGCGHGPGGSGISTAQSVPVVPVRVKTNDSPGRMASGVALGAWSASAAGSAL
jgi:hypothetical protein